MAGLKEYVSWRGDLSFSADPLNEVDLICFSQLAVLDFGGIFKRDITLKEMFKLYAATGRATSLLGVMVPYDMNVIFKAMAESNRFGGVVIKDRVYEYDAEKILQFGATVYETRAYRLVCFSGTDDTIIGWQENINLAMPEPVPAQKRAVEYLTEFCDTPKKLYVFGHSKGGNLSLYSFANCDSQTASKVTGCYCFDGPALREETFTRPEVSERLPRMKTILPPFSVVGRLFFHEEELFVVKSIQRYLGQHDCFSWEVVGNRLIKNESGFMRGSDEMEKNIKRLIADTDGCERDALFESFFGWLLADGDSTLTDLEKKRKNFIAWYMTLPREEKKIIKSILTQVIKDSSARSFFTDLQKQWKDKKAYELKALESMKKSIDEKNVPHA